MDDCDASSCARVRPYTNILKRKGSAAPHLSTLSDPRISAAVGNIVLEGSPSLSQEPPRMRVEWKTKKPTSGRPPTPFAPPIISSPEEANLLGIKERLEDGKISEAKTVIEVTLPGLLQQRQELQLRLVTQQFVELCRLDVLAKKVRSMTTCSCPSSLNFRERRMNVKLAQQLLAKSEPVPLR